MKDASETLSTSTEEFLRLQREVEHLQQENRVLHIRAQGVQVLGMFILSIDYMSEISYKSPW